MKTTSTRSHNGMTNTMSPLASPVVFALEPQRPKADLTSSQNLTKATFAPTNASGLEPNNNGGMPSSLASSGGTNHTRSSPVSRFVRRLCKIN